MLPELCVGSVFLKYVTTNEPKGTEDIRE